MTHWQCHLLSCPGQLKTNRMTLAMKSLSLSRNDTTTQNYCLGIDLLNIISSWYEENYLKPYFFTLSTWKIISEDFERIYQIVEKSTSHIDEIQDFRWTSSSGTLRTCYWGVANWFVQAPSCQDAWHQGSPSSPPTARASNQASPPSNNQPHCGFEVFSEDRENGIMVMTLILWMKILIDRYEELEADDLFSR